MAVQIDTMVGEVVTTCRTAEMPPMVTAVTFRLADPAPHRFPTTTTTKRFAAGGPRGAAGKVKVVAEEDVLKVPR